MFIRSVQKGCGQSAPDMSYLSSTVGLNDGRFCDADHHESLLGHCMFTPDDNMNDGVVDQK